MLGNKNSNKLGFPLLEAISITSDGTNTTIAFNPSYNYGNLVGGFWIKIPSIVTTSTEPLYFTVNNINNSTIPIYTNTGTQATVASIANSVANTYHLMFYDSTANRVQLIA